VPFIINTFYPPNQPSVRRCFSLGRALADTIAARDADLRVAIIGSGGMSHFVVDEELDRTFLDAMKRKDADALISIPPYNFRSGTSELKNWIPVAGAMKEMGLDMTVIDYQPLYRSAAGTGSGMAFAYWR
jgi:3-O-methylgallate 3,4-dioxygenase